MGGLRGVRVTAAAVRQRLIHGYGAVTMAQPPGPPPRPPKRSLLPYLIVAGAVLVSGLVILLAVRLTGGKAPAPQAAATTTSSPSPAATESRENTADGTPSGDHVVEPKNTEGGRFAGSGEVAFRWVRAMAARDFPTAYDLSCPEVQATTDAAAVGDDPAETLGAYFYDRTLGGEGFTEATFDSVEYSSHPDSDIASFTLRLDSGEEFVLLIYVNSDVTVCDFV